MSPNIFCALKVLTALRSYFSPRIETEVRWCSLLGASAAEGSIATFFLPWVRLPSVAPWLPSVGSLGSEPASVAAVFSSLVFVLYNGLPNKASTQPSSPALALERIAHADRQLLAAQLSSLQHEPVANAPTASHQTQLSTDPPSNKGANSHRCSPSRGRAALSAAPWGPLLPQSCSAYPLAASPSQRILRGARRRLAYIGVACRMLYVRAGAVEQIPKCEHADVFCCCMM